MLVIASAIITILSVIVLIPVLTFSLQCLLSLLPFRKNKFAAETPPRLAVLIPAHNEQSIISGIIEDVSSQINEGDRMIVIADNCTDDTAKVSRSLGAEVFEREDLTERGKSHALRFALEKLAAAPPEVVIVVDADCRITPGTLNHLSTKANGLNRPVQGSYIFGGPKDSATSNLASSFTLWFKNHIRPLGSLRAGMPCQLTGSGMAFPWDAIGQVNFANKSLAEDTTLGLELAYAGYEPMFCPEARIDGNVPKEWGTLVQQRRRWEQGYLESILSNAPKMISRSISTFRPQLLWAAFDLCIPPLALLGMAWGLMTVAAAVLAQMGGSPIPVQLLVVGALLTGISLFLGWLFHCRSQVPMLALFAIPWFLLRKIAIYISLLVKREKVWLRTERD